MQRIVKSAASTRATFLAPDTLAGTLGPAATDSASAGCRFQHRHVERAAFSVIVGREIGESSLDERQRRRSQKSDTAFRCAFKTNAETLLNAMMTGDAQKCIN